MEDHIKEINKMELNMGKGNCIILMVHIMKEILKIIKCMVKEHCIINQVRKHLKDILILINLIITENITMKCQNQGM